MWRKHSVNLNALALIIVIIRITEVLHWINSLFECLKYIESYYNRFNAFSVNLFQNRKVHWNPI